MRPPALLRNDSEWQGHWLRLGLNGAGAARSPIGARIVVEAGGRMLVRVVAAGTSNLSSGDRRVLVGLGLAERVDRLEVRWPSGRVGEWMKLAADQTLELVEAEARRPP